MASRKRKPESEYRSPEESRLDDEFVARPNVIEKMKSVVPGQGGRRIEWPCEMGFDDFCYYFLGYKMWSVQRECANLMWSEPNFAWATGQKLGKTDALGCVLLGHAYMHDDARAIFVAPTQRQCTEVVWRVVQRLWRGNGICWDCKRAGVRVAPCPHSAILPGQCWQTPFSGLETPWGSQVIGFPQTEPDRAQGFSSPWLRWMVDEASGIGRPMWEAIQGNRMGGAPLSICLNPVCTSGPAFEVFHKHKNEWCLRQTSSEHSPNFTGEAQREFGGQLRGLAEPGFIRWAERVYGRDSLFFRTRITAEFATSFELQIFPWDVVNRAVERWKVSQGATAAHLQIGYDPAGLKLTGDANALAAVRADRCLAIQAKKGIGLLWGGHVNYVVNFIEQHRQGSEPVVLVVDAAGAEGSKALGELQAFAGQPGNGWLYVAAVYSGAFPPEHTEEREHYHTIRDVLFAHCAEWLASGGAIPFDESLVEQMALPMWSVDERSRKRATAKDDMRAATEGRRSPDELDALCLATYRGREVRGLFDDDDVPSKESPPNMRDALRRSRRAVAEYVGYLRRGGV